MGFISCHITPLVIYSLGGGHTHMHTTHRQTHILTNQKPGMGWLKEVHNWFENREFVMYMYVCT